VFLNNSNQNPVTGRMDYLFNNEPQGKSKKDKRFTLILVIGSVFLLVYAVQIMVWNTSEKAEVEGYVLKIDNTSLSVIAENKQEKEHISSIPWDFTPFFFEKMPINSADKEALMTIKGIGPKLAESILQSRLENGPFEESADLLKIKGVGPKRAVYFEKMFDFNGK